MDGVHELKTNERQRMCPSALLAGDVVAQHLDDCAVGSLTHAIGFRVVRRGELELDTSVAMQGSPEVQHKELVTVRNNGTGKAVLAIPVLEKQDRKILGSDVGAARDEPDVRAQAASHGGNAVMAIVFWTAVRDRKWVERPDWLDI